MDKYLKIIADIRRFALFQRSQKKSFRVNELPAYISLGIQVFRHFLDVVVYRSIEPVEAIGQNRIDIFGRVCNLLFHKVFGNLFCLL